MNGKGIAELVVSTIVGLSLIYAIISWMLNSFDNSGIENIKLGIKLITDVVFPWWLGIIEWFAGLHVKFQVFLIFIFIFVLFLIWIGKDET